MNNVHLRLGTSVLRPRRTGVSLDSSLLSRRVDAEPSRFTIGEVLVLEPRDSVIGSTLEFVALSPDTIGFVTGRSDLARAGLSVGAATLVAPGFCGTVVLEMSHLGAVPIRLVVGMRIAELYLAIIG